MWLGGQVERGAKLTSPHEGARAQQVLAALLALGMAEQLMREDKPHEALEQLGGGVKPPNVLPLLERLTWYWLAGWALVMGGQPANAVRILEQGLQMAEAQGRMRAPVLEARRAQMIERLHCFLGIA